MKRKESTLRAFILESLSEQGYNVNEEVYDALISHVKLTEGDPDEEEETRSVKIKEDSDGKVSAKSFKLYNTLMVSNYDLGKLLIDGVEIALFEDIRKKIAYGLLKLIYEFCSNIKYEFNETDAKILLSLYKLGKKQFNASDLHTQYSADTTPSVSYEQIERSLNFFKDLRVVKYLGNGQYEMREKITYERN